MKLENLISIMTIIICCELSPVGGQIRPERQWTSYRGYMSSGVLDNADLPESFDIEKSVNIRWKVMRDENPCWCTPNIYKNGDQTIIAVNGYKHRGGYDFQSGKEIWRMSGGGDVPIPTPIVGDGIIYFNSAHGSSSPILAVKSNAVGDITLKPGEKINEYVKWSIPRGGSYIHSLLLYRDHLYNVNWNGVLQCYDPNSGNEIFKGKLGTSGSFIASPVASDGRIYIVDEEGKVFVIKDGTSFIQLNEIPLGDKCLVAPAITDGMIFFRTQKYLIAVGKSVIHP